MIHIFKLTNGEQIIGRLEETELTNQDFYSILNPMLVIDSTPLMEEAGYGGMRLRDAMILSDDDKLVIPAKFCITVYNPSAALLKYYDRASVFYRKYTKKDIDRQIEDAVLDLEQAVREREASSKTLADVLAKLSIPKGKLH